MEEFFALITSNHTFNVAFISWFTAQLLKMIIVLITEKRIDIRKMLASGGMPSSHSAFVVALAVSIGKICGIASTQFALALGFACIVMYDAAVIRRAAGEQAKILNKMMDDWENKEPNFVKKELKELLGHTPLQVFAGAALGFLFAFFIY